MLKRVSAIGTTHGARVVSKSGSGGGGTARRSARRSEIDLISQGTVQHTLAELILAFTPAHSLSTQPLSPSPSERHPWPTPSHDLLYPLWAMAVSVPRFAATVLPAVVRR